MSRRQLLGVLGSILLFLGVFAPIISLPMAGSINYFHNGRGDGTIVLVLAVISLVLTFAKKYHWLWVTGLGSLALLAFTFFSFQARLSDVKLRMNIELADNPFRGLADLAMESIQLQWGWAVLVVGAVLVIAAAAVKDREDTSLHTETA